MKMSFFCPSNGIQVTSRGNGNSNMESSNNNSNTDSNLSSSPARTTDTETAAAATNTGLSSSSSSTTPTDAPATSTTALKCSQCGKKGKKGCTQSLCLKCCLDDTCQVHKEQRQQALFKEQVMAGTTPIQLQAKEMRTVMRIDNSNVGKSRSTSRSSGRDRFFFRESAFQYLGDTVVIWKLSDYLEKPKWKEEALRKAAKRKQIMNNYSSSEIGIAGTTSIIISDDAKKGKRKLSRRQRCRRIMESLYQQSLQHQSSAAASNTHTMKQTS